MQKYVTVKKLARELDCHRETILRLLRAGTIPAVKVGRTWRIDHEMAILAMGTRRLA